MVGLAENGRKATADDVKGMRWTFKGARLLGFDPGQPQKEFGEVRLDPGKEPKQIDVVARFLLDDANSGKRFCHGLSNARRGTTIELVDSKSTESSAPPCR